MADVPQTIVQPAAAPTTKVYGARKDANLQSAFPTSPLYNGDLSDAERKKAYSELLSEPASEGLGVNNFNPDFSDNGAPDIAALESVIDDNGNEIKIGEGAGAPTTPYVPPLTSPGPGNFNASDQPPFTGAAPEAGSEYGSGLGATANPRTTSTSIEAQKIGDTLIQGRSYLGSDGKG